MKSNANKVGWLVLLLTTLLLPALPCSAQTRFVKTVNTIEQMAALNINDVHTNVFVADTNRGGMFVLVASSETTNNGTVIKSQASGYRYRRQFTGPVNVKWFGAKGNYTTDDTTAIQDAINSSKLGSDLYFPGGKYMISSSLIVTNPVGYSITGDKAGLHNGFTDSYGSWLVWSASASTNYMLIYYGAKHFNLHGLGFMGSNNVNGLKIVSFNTPVSFNLDAADCYVFQCAQGIKINPSGASTQSDHMVFRNIRMDEIGTNCWMTDSDNATGIQWFNCHTALASSATNTINYYFKRGNLLSLYNCSGGYGQDFIRIEDQVTKIEIYACQSESSTNADRTFLRDGSAAPGSCIGSITLMNSIPDNPIILNLTSRRFISIGNLYRDQAVRLVGDNVYVFSLGDFIQTGGGFRQEGAATYLSIQDYFGTVLNLQTNDLTSLLSLGSQPITTSVPLRFSSNALSSVTRSGGVEYNGTNGWFFSDVVRRYEVPMTLRTNFAWSPGSVTTNVLTWNALPGAEVGDWASASYSDTIPPSGILTARVETNDVVTVYIHNADPVTAPVVVPAGTVRVQVTKQ